MREKARPPVPLSAVKNSGNEVVIRLQEQITLGPVTVLDIPAIKRLMCNQFFGSVQIQNFCPTIIRKGGGGGGAVVAVVERE